MVTMLNFLGSWLSALPLWAASWSPSILMGRPTRPLSKTYRWWLEAEEVAVVIFISLPQDKIGGKLLTHLYSSEGWRHSLGVPV